MTSNNVISRWIKSFFNVIVFLISLIAYGSRRTLVLSWLGNNGYRLGFFEGIIATVFFFYIADRFVPALNEFINGIRALGRQTEQYHTSSPARESSETIQQPQLEPSFPLERWEFLWFRYVEDRSNPWGDFISQSYKNELNFDEDWDQGIVNNSGLSNNVAFKASRTIQLENAGRYIFRIGADDGVRLFLYNNLSETKLEINEWKDQQYSEFERSVELPAGVYKILLEWYEHYGAARARFTMTL